MLDQGKLTPYQLFCIIAAFLAGNSIIMQSLNVAGRDTWMSVILAVLAGVGMVWVTTRLAVQFPSLTLIEYAQVLFGKNLGKVIGIFYVWFFLHLGSLVLRNYGEFMTTLIMPETPLWFFDLSLALVVAYLVYQGVEVMGRLSEIILFLDMVFIVIAMTLLGLSGILDIKNLYPLLEGGTSKVIQGVIPTASFPYLQIILFTMIFPRVNMPARSRKAAIWAIVLIGMVLDGVLIMGIALLGETMASLSFPGYYIFRLIRVGEFIERIDPVLMSMFLMGSFIKIGVCFYAFVLGLAQLLGLKDYKPLIMPSSVIMVVIGLLAYDNTFEIFNFATNIYPVYAFPFQVVLPILMLILARFRNKEAKARNE